MKPLLALLCLLLAACASSDGFEDNQVQACGPESLIAVEAGWDRSNMDRPGENQLVLLVRVANNSHEDVTVKAIRADPMPMDRDSMYEIERGSYSGDILIAQGDDHTFELPMLSRTRFRERGGGVRASGVDVAVTVVTSEDVSVRCRFRLPLGF